MKKIRVGIAYYNGSKYIDEQVESILNQKFDKKEYELEIVIQDDGSNGKNLTYLKAISNKYDQVIVVKNNGNKGAALTFMDILFNAKEEGVDYLFWCDQDDIWLDGKISKQISSLGNGVASTHLSSRTNFNDIKTDPKSCKQSFSGHQMAFDINRFFDEVNITRVSFYDGINKYIEYFNKKYHDYFIKYCMLASGLEFIHINEVLVMHRIHESSLTNSINFDITKEQSYGKYSAYPMYWKYLKLAIPAIIGKKLSINTFNKHFYYIDHSPFLGWMRWKYCNSLMLTRQYYLYSLPDRIATRNTIKKHDKDNSVNSR